MDEVDLGVPQQLMDSLPEGGDDAARDMERAVEGYQARVNRMIRDASDDAEAASRIVDVVEQLEARAETYDGFVPELRAWGQSPIYAIVWRNLCADLIGQLYEHEGLAERLDRERNHRLVDDGIRLRDVTEESA